MDFLSVTLLKESQKKSEKRKEGEREGGRVCGRPSQYVG